MQNKRTPGGDNKMIFSAIPVLLIVGVCLFGDDD